MSLTFANSSSGATGSSSCYRGCPEPDEKALGATIDCLVRNAKRSENRVEVDVYVNYGYPFFESDSRVFEDSACLIIACPLKIFILITLEDSIALCQMMDLAEKRET